MCQGNCQANVCRMYAAWLDTKSRASTG
jgi:hypothetical protein